MLHPTSLPGSGRRGDIGHEAYRFAEFLAAAGISLWQLLPLHPTHRDGSPYQSPSAFAGSPELISMDWLVDRGWLAGDYQRTTPRQRLIRAAWDGFKGGAAADQRDACAAFRDSARAWLEDYALYLALREQQHGKPWTSWPRALREREPAALARAGKEHAERIAWVVFEQFVFHAQWAELKAYCNRLGIDLFGDLPLYVAHDSADVWARQEYFALDEQGLPALVAGVPPDYFAAQGQRWGNPLYRWDALAADGFEWWINRLAAQANLFDLLRIDHFRGLEAYWEIPAACPTAVAGRWVKAPGNALLAAVRKRFPALKLVAENLGTITPEVETLRHRFAIPGMAVLQFAFDSGADNPYLPHNHTPDTVVYTGTHDNDTTLGWFRALTAERQGRILEFFGHPGEPMPWPLIRCALASVATIAILPFQDLLELGGEARMNTPGTTSGNWQWRFAWRQVPTDLAADISRLLALYGRGK